MTRVWIAIGLVCVILTLSYSEYYLCRNTSEELLEITKQIEAEDDYDDLSFKEMIIETVKANIKYVVMAVAGLIVLIIVIKVIGSINRRKEPKYKGKH